MKNRKLLGIILSLTLVFSLGLSSCATIEKENYGTFANISVPAKDFTSLGLVFTENVIESNQGQVFTYYALLKEAKALGADTIVNVTIDVKREGMKFLGIHSSPKETWYGSATAIKYGAAVKEVPSTTTGDTTVTAEGVIMSSGGNTSSSSSEESASDFVCYNPFTWF